VTIFPYLADDPDRKAWKDFGNSTNVVENVFVFANKWNTYLSAVGAAARISGVTLDVHEMVASTVYPIVLNTALVSGFKTKYGLKELGALINYDDRTSVVNMNSYIDKFFLFYTGFYYPTQSVNRSPTLSPFVLNKNNPAAMATFINQNILLPGLKSSLLPYLSKLNAMWSLETPLGQCLYPQANGNCGHNYDFGTWRPDSYNAFVRQIQAISPEFFSKIPQGSYTYGWTPKSWVPGAIVPATTAKPAVSTLLSTIKPTTAITTTAKPATVITTTSKPVPTTAPGKIPGCAFSGARPIAGYLWTDAPIEFSTRPQWARYFVGMREYMARNCANMVINKVLMNVPQPLRDGGLLLPSPSSVLYMEFLKYMSPGTVLNIMPYIGEEGARLKWITYGGSSSVIENVFKFTYNWNVFLKSVGSTVRFTGVTLDYEELVNIPSRYNIAVSKPMIAGFKTKYGISEFSGAVGSKAIANVNAFTFFDHFFLEFYDFGNAIAKNAVLSPFVIYKDNPQAMVNYILRTEVASPVLQAFYVANAHKISAMWSIQSLTGGCIYPLRNGKCGLNYEFGVWRADTFNAFITLLKSSSPIFNNVAHGFFEYSFIPKSWVPASSVLASR
jgi:hypothetical protein